MFFFCCKKKIRASKEKNYTLVCRFHKASRLWTEECVGMLKLFYRANEPRRALAGGFLWSLVKIETRRGSSKIGKGTLSKKRNWKKVFDHRRHRRQKMESYTSKSRFKREEIITIQLEVDNGFSLISLLISK